MLNSMYIFYYNYFNKEIFVPYLSFKYLTQNKFCFQICYDNTHKKYEITKYEFYLL